MAKQPRAAFSLPIAIDRASHTPLYRQIYEAIRQAILDGRLRSGLRLPSTRTLANEVGVSRNIMVLAFEQLLTEGYVRSRTGSGTTVARSLPEEFLHVGRRSSQLPQSRRHSLLSHRGLRISELTSAIRSLAPAARLAPFQYGLPALEELPLELWGRLVARHFRRAPKELLVHGDPAGLWALREAIASYVGAARGVRCSPNQVIVVNGSQQAVDLAGRVLLDPGDRAVVENPGYFGARSALKAAGIQLVPVPVDQEGLSITALKRKPGKLKLVYVTPSHQFPLGVAMSLNRRLELLDWAARRSAWIFEDDYDSEYRYESRPIPALQGLDQEGRVIYVGTLSKVLFPAIRFGYLIVPDDLVQPFVAARALTDLSSPQVEQAALAEFISEGHLARHIRRMRALYMERRDFMKRMIEENIACIEVNNTEAGMHFVGWLPSGTDDAAIAREALKVGLQVMPVSAFAIHTLSRPGLLLGFAGFSKPVIRKGISELARVVKNSIQQ
jgi:GntR family transcriptional regulator / MocR family aminotransferase